MSSTTPDPPGSGSKRPSPKSTADPILQNALRYTISAKEYETLHKYIISRSKLLKRNAPSVAKVEKLVVGRNGSGSGGRYGGGDFNVAAVRASLRVFLVTAAGLRAWDVVKKRMIGGRVRFVVSLGRLRDYMTDWMCTVVGRKCLYGNRPIFVSRCLFLRYYYSIGSSSAFSRD